MSEGATHSELAMPAIKRPMGWALVVRLGGVGDNIMASSVLPLLAQKYRIEFMAQDPHHVVLENNPFIDKLTVKRSDDIPGLGGKVWYDWFASRAKEYDYFVNLSHTCETTLAAVAAQSQFYWPASWRRKYFGHSYLEFIHDVANVPHVFNPRFYPTDEEREKAITTKAGVGKRVVGWCIAGSRLDKSYPYSPMAIARIIKELGCPVILFGAPGKQSDWAQTIGDHVVRQNGNGDGLHQAIAADYDLSSDEDRARLGLKPGVVNWPIRRILSQVLTCDLMIGPDTGPMWAASMEDVPKIVMVSHASPQNITKHWRKTTTLHADPKRVPCWPCHQLHDTQDTCTPNKEKNGAACISDITVEHVLKTAENILKHKEYV